LLINNKKKKGDLIMIDGGFGYGEMGVTDSYSSIQEKPQVFQSQTFKKVQNAFSQKSNTSTPFIMDPEFEREYEAQLQALDLGDLDDIDGADFEPEVAKPVKIMKKTAVKADGVFKAQKKGKSFFAKLGDLFGGVLSGLTALNGRIEIFMGKVFGIPVNL
jgi:hypothetical protein